MTAKHKDAMKTLSTALAMAVVIAGCVWGLFSAAAAEQARIVPAPAQDVAAGQAPTEVAVLAGGCFWGVQGVFQHVKGVVSAVSGYTGGTQISAEYETVSSGHTGHAESV